MLLWMVLRSHANDQRSFWSGSDGLTLLTGVLGLVWNIGAFCGYGLLSIGLLGPSPVLLAVALSALGFLPAVVVHSVLRSRGMLGQAAHRCILLFAYGLSFIGSVLHLRVAVVTQHAPSQSALVILTIGFVAVMIALLLSTRKQPGWGRALWVVALAVFAVSALHLSRREGADPWWLALTGHQASLPLALAFLHEDYRFALADMFLKRALALILLVSLVFGLYAMGISPLLGSAIGNSIADQRTTLMLLAMWVVTALAYPWIRTISASFVDKMVLRRADYDMLLAEVGRSAGRHETAEAILHEMKHLLGPALTAHSIQWKTMDAPDAQSPQNLVSVTVGRKAVAFIPTVEPPYYYLSIDELGGGRRLLSDDIAAIERVALLLARRIDAVRTAQERLETNLREREMSKLAAEAELRALRAQIHPHFLFNALTTIGYLIQTAPDQALTTLMRLSGLLRSVLRSGPEFATLGDELNIVEAYLDIERARFEDRLKVSIDVPQQLRHLRIPALLIQPIVENAIKHGIGKSLAGGEVRIAATRNESPATLRIIVEDSGAGADELQFSNGRRRGVGLNNVDRRLKCYGQGLASMKIRSHPGLGTRVEIELPAEVPAPAGITNEARFTGRH